MEEKEQVAQNGIHYITYSKHEITSLGYSY